MNIYTIKRIIENYKEVCIIKMIHTTKGNTYFIQFAYIPIIVFTIEFEFLREVAMIIFYILNILIML